MMFLNMTSGMFKMGFVMTQTINNSLKLALRGSGGHKMVASEIALQSAVGMLRAHGAIAKARRDMQFYSRLKM